MPHKIDEGSVSKVNTFRMLPLVMDLRERSAHSEGLCAAAHLQTRTTRVPFSACAEQLDAKTLQNFS